MVRNDRPIFFFFLSLFLAVYTPLNKNQFFSDSVNMIVDFVPFHVFIFGQMKQKKKLFAFWI